MSESRAEGPYQGHTPNSSQRAIYRQFARGYDEGALKHSPEWLGDSRICSLCGVKLTNKNSYRNCKGEPK